MKSNPIYTSKKLLDELLNDGSAPPEWLWDLLNRRGGLIILSPSEPTQESESSALSSKLNVANTTTEPTQR